MSLKYTEISCCSWIEDHFTDVTPSVCEIGENNSKKTIFSLGIPVLYVCLCFQILNIYKVENRKYNTLFPDKVELRLLNSTSHTLIVWSQDALQILSTFDHRTKEIASLWPERVGKRVLVSPNCSVFCFFLNLWIPPISSSLSIGTVN